MFLAVWWGEKSYRFWLGEADGNELREQGTAAAAAAAATATAQLCSIWQRGPWAATDESDSCVCAGISGEPQLFPFVCVALLQGLKRVTQLPHPKSTLSLCTYFSQCLRCGQPWPEQRGWLASCRRDVYSLQARVVWASSKWCTKSPQLMLRCREGATEDTHVGAILLVLLGNTCTQGSAVQSLRILPAHWNLCYLLALVNSPLWPWETLQPLSYAGPKLQQSSGSRRVFWAGEWPRKIQGIHSVRASKEHPQCKKLLPACKRETMPALAPWIAFFLQKT